jgi:hypothetical protein
MAKSTKALKPDIVLKNYWSNNEQFADLFNAVLFQGRELIKPEELEDVDTEESSILEHRDYAESIGAARDNIKIQKKATSCGVELVLLGLEGQEHVHYAMPMRVMGYDYGSYKKQYDNTAQKYKAEKGLDGDEYLSRMRKTDRFIPVITVVIYYGEKPWDGATSLHGMLNIPEEMQPFVNDYKMLLVEARQNNLTLHNVNNRDLFNLLEILLDQNRSLHETKQKAIDYATEHTVDKSVVMTVAGAANCNIDYNELDRKGDADMCTVFEETRTEGRAEEIIAMGHEFGLSESDILTKLQEKLDISSQKAQEYLRQFGKG